jgi:TonB-dependent receptor
MKKLAMFVRLTALGSTALSSAAYAQQAAPTPTPTPAEEPVGEIVVSGIRASLQDALEIRRKADVILDGISADDIGSTPDLNLGEALQRIPGVQINRSADRRDASISVRGLPSQYTKTTVMGQSVATPTFGTRGNGNPFGIYDAAIFSGADVIKSFTPEIPAGGLAANVDLRLRPALSRKEGFVARAELQYEESTEDANPGYFLSATKRLTSIFAVYAVGSYAKQSFRRDTIRVNSYTSFSAPRLAELALTDAAFAIPATTGGIANDVVFPSEVRQISQTNDGYRISGGAGLEWKVSPSLNLRLDGIYTKRDLSDANIDLMIAFPQDLTGIVTPLSKPISLGTFDRGSNGSLENVYVVNKIAASDFAIPIGNRGSPSLDQSWAVYPQLNFRNDSWAIDFVGTYSKALGDRRELLYEQRIQPNTGRADVNRDGIDDAGNGAYAVIDTGLGNYRDFLFDLRAPAALTSVGNGTYVVSAGNGTQARNSVRPENVVFTASGNGVRVKRNLLAADFKIEKFVNVGPFTSVKVGAYYAQEKADQTFQENANLGTQLNRLGNDIFKLNDAVTSGSPFFGGGAPGAALSSFLSLNIPAVENAIYPILTTPPPGVAFTFTAAQLAAFFPELTPAARSRITYADILAKAPRNSLTGFIQRFPLNRVEGQNFDSKRDNLELFAMTKFDFEQSGGIPLRGNAGIRYVRSNLSGLTRDQALDFYTALGFTRADFRPGYFSPPQPATGKYSAWLPSANLVYEITPKLVARAAYYKTFEAFDLVEFSPAPTRILEDVDPDAGETISSVRIDVNRFGLQPRSSRAFDLGVSYYNRPGSVIALGYFNKRVNNDILTLNNFCPVGQSFSIEGESFGPLFTDAAGRCRINQGQAVETANQRIVINQIVNNPDAITVNGLEFQVQQRFDFLPGFLANTGGVFNYTRVRSGGANGTKLYNVANDTYNIIGYYEDKTLQLRLAYNHASDIELAGGSTFTGSASRVRPRGQLDFSGAITPSPWLEFRFELYNITNSRREEYEGDPRLNRVADFDGRTGSISLTVKF